MHIYVVRDKEAEDFEVTVLLQVLKWVHELGHTFKVIDRRPPKSDLKVGDIYLYYRQMDNHEKDVDAVEMQTFDPLRNEMKIIFFWSTTYVETTTCYGLFVRKRAAERLPTKIRILIDEGAPIQMAVPVADKV